MPSSDADIPIVLTILPTELLASLLIARLRSEGLLAEMSGGLTSGMRAEAPGQVQILVRSKDIARARDVLAAWEEDGR